MGASFLIFGFFMGKRSRLCRKSRSSVSVKTSNSVNNSSDYVNAEQDSDTWYNNVGPDKTAVLSFFTKTIWNEIPGYGAEEEDNNIRGATTEAVLYDFGLSMVPAPIEDDRVDYDGSFDDGTDKNMLSAICMVIGDNTLETTLQEYVIEDIAKDLNFCRFMLESCASAVCGFLGRDCEKASDKAVKYEMFL